MNMGMGTWNLELSFPVCFGVPSILNEELSEKNSKNVKHTFIYLSVIIRNNQNCKFIFPMKNNLTFTVLQRTVKFSMVLVHCQVFACMYITALAVLQLNKLLAFYPASYAFSRSLQNTALALPTVLITSSSMCTALFRVLSKICELVNKLQFFLPFT